MRCWDRTWVAHVQGKLLLHFPISRLFLQVLRNCHPRYVEQTVPTLTASQMPLPRNKVLVMAAEQIVNIAWQILNLGPTTWWALDLL